MKLIDADAIKADIDKSIFDSDDKEWYLTLLVNAPIIDIVFCKECKYYNGNEEYCSVDHYATENGFCSYGERRSE